MRKIYPLLLLSLMVMAFSAFAQDEAPVANPPACVETFDESADYFPDQATFTHAEGVEVAYFSHYKIVTVTNAFAGAEPIDYVLVQCGTPTPDDIPAAAQIIEVPVSSVAMLSTTQLPHLTLLDALDALVAVDSGMFIYDATVRELVADGVVDEIGGGANVNVELALDIAPDAIFAYGFSPDTDAHPVLIDAGIFTALNGEHREASPLGRAEWLKFTALFFNAEAEAEAVFAEIESRYNALIDLVAENVPEDERVLVLPNAFSPFTDAWSIPGSETYAGFFLQHAGADVVLGDEVTDATDSVLFDFEVIYDAGLDADVWFLNAFGVFTADDLLAMDERFADFAAFQNGRVYNNVGRVNEAGGTDYFEGGVTAPDVILADFIAILYPELLPEHELVYWVPIR